MNSPIQWFGGKGSMTNDLLPYLVKHTTYVEPFGGGASLLFAKGPSDVEVYNDKDKRLVNMFRMLRTQGDKFVEMVNLMPYSRYEHQIAKGVLDYTPPPNGSVVQAVYFYYRCRSSMSGDLHGGWSYGREINCAAKWVNAIEKLPQIVERLRNVQVECDHAFKIIERFDGPETIFYLDPPYWPGTRGEKRYDEELSTTEHILLLQLCNKLKGMCFISGYDCMAYQDGLDKEGWYRKEIDTVSRATGTTRKSGILGEGSLKELQKRKEVIWWNKHLEANRKQLDWISQKELGE